MLLCQQTDSCSGRTQVRPLELHGVQEERPEMPVQVAWVAYTALFGAAGASLEENIRTPGSIGIGIGSAEAEAAAA